MQRNVLFRRVWILGSLALLALAGCGGVKTYPVSGAITYADGSPMPGGGQISFDPADPMLPKSYSARGIIKDDGTFKMGTFAETDGVPEGKYFVTIVPTPPWNPRKPPEGYPPIHEKYMDHRKSGLEFTVTRGKNDFPVVVEKPPGRE